MKYLLFSRTIIYAINGDKTSSETPTAANKIFKRFHYSWVIYRIKGHLIIGEWFIEFDKYPDLQL